MMTIKPELKALIPPLAEDERKQLEQNLIADGCREPLVVWKNGDGKILIDGHNRLEICERNSIPFEVTYKDFDSEVDARVWMRENQMGRRNLTKAWSVDLQLENKKDIEAKGIKKMSEGGQAKSGQGLLQNNKPSEPAHRTREEIAKAANVSPGTVAQAEQVKKKAPELWEKAKAGDVSISAAYKDVKKQERKAAVVEKLTSIESIEAKELKGEYDVIVIDPPWPMQKIDRNERPNQTAFDYPVMSETELSVMEMPAGDDCHMWLWTTHKYLPMALRLVNDWGFKYVCTFVWHKPGGFQPFGLPQYNCEFAIYCRKGSPIFLDTKAFPVAFNEPRGKHSEKPEGFYDVVRRVTGGRRIDIFNRRKIDGFDVWGKEADE